MDAIVASGSVKKNLGNLLRKRPGATQQQFDEGLGTDEGGATDLQADQLSRALCIHELDLRKIDLIRKALAGNRVPENADVRARHRPGYMHDAHGVLSQAINAYDHFRGSRDHDPCQPRAKKLDL
jgi:hypothetical protein